MKAEGTSSRRIAKCRQGLDTWPWEKASQIGLSEPGKGFRSEKLLLPKIYPILMETRL